MIDDDKAGRLTLEASGDNFILRRAGSDGKISEIALTDRDVLTLAQMSTTLKQQLLARHSPTGGAISAVVAADVVQIALNTDAMQDRVLLTLIAPGGSQATYALPEIVAKLLADHLPKHIANLTLTGRRQ